MIYDNKYEEIIILQNNLFAFLNDTKGKIDPTNFAVITETLEDFGIELARAYPELEELCNLTEYLSKETTTQENYIAKLEERIAKTRQPEIDEQIEKNNKKDSLSIKFQEKWGIKL